MTVFISRRVVFLLIASSIVIGGATACGQGGGEGPAEGQDRTLSGEDVRREIVEAFDTTAKYLSERGKETAAALEERKKEAEEEAARLRERAAAAGEWGREFSRETLESLREKEEEVKRRYGDFKAEGGELTEEAARALDEALRDLESAYERAWERFGSEDR